MGGVAVVVAGVLVATVVATSGTSAAPRSGTPDQDKPGPVMHVPGLAAAGGALDPGACPTACRQLAPGSTLLQELAKEPIPSTLPWLSVWTERDETVTPPDSARLDGAVNVALQQVCPGNQAA